MGRRLVGAAVAGVLVLGGGVAVAGPAAAVGRPGVSAGASGPAVVRTAPVRTGLRAHQITDQSAHSVSRHKRKVRRSVAGRVLDAVFGWVAVVVVLVLVLVVLLVFAVRRRRQAG